MQAQMGFAAAPAAAAAPAVQLAQPAAAGAAIDYNSGASDMEDEDECTIDEAEIADLDKFVISPADARRQEVQLPIRENDEMDPAKI